MAEDCSIVRKNYVKKKIHDLVCLELESRNLADKIIPGKKILKRIKEISTEIQHIENEIIGYVEQLERLYLGE